MEKPEAESNEKIYSVSELTDNIKQLLESKFLSVMVEGEISNYSKHSSGHIYLTLRDADAQISAMIWRSIANKLKREFSEGDKVVVQGNLTLYKPNGRYQITINSIKLVGVGEASTEIEKLKNKLHAEGLFDARYKKEIPKISGRIGVVTSPTGAVIRDIVSVINRRYPIAEVILYPVAVQGMEAGKEIAEAIDNFNLYGNINVMIVGRGGGSAEDLSPFNEEIVARAIFRSKIPIISAVGHEIDYSISDLVADLRAPTPSVAAETVVPDRDEIIGNVFAQVNFLYFYIKDMIRKKRERIKTLLKDYSFNKPLDMLNMYRQKIDEYLNTIETNIHYKVNMQRQTVESLNMRLVSVNPNIILKRGYCYVERDKKIITDSKTLKENDNIEIMFYDNKRKAKIIS